MQLLAVSETASTILVASVAGEGLVLAVYALITSILDKIIKARSELVEENRKEVNSLLDVYNKNKTDENFERLTKSHNRLSNLRSFPAFFSVGMFSTFLFYSLASFFAFLSLGDSYFEGVQSLFFLFATLVFVVVGIYTFLEVSKAMKHEWKALEEEKQKAEKTTSEELQKLKEDVEELKRQSEAKNVTKL